MRHFLKNIVLSSALLSAGLFASACGEDAYNEDQEPEIFDMVTDIYEAVDEATSGVGNYCVDAKAALDKIIANDKAGYTRTCKEYAESRKNANNDPKRLSKDTDNAGFYMASFIFIEDMRVDFDGCEGKAGVGDRFEELFNKFGCDTIIEDAKKVIKERGRN